MHASIFQKVNERQSSMLLIQFPRHRSLWPWDGSILHGSLITRLHTTKMFTPFPPHSIIIITILFFVREEVYIKNTKQYQEYCFKNPQLQGLVRGPKKLIKTYDIYPTIEVIQFQKPICKKRSLSTLFSTCEEWCRP